MQTWLTGFYNFIICRFWIYNMMVSTSDGILQFIHQLFASWTYYILPINDHTLFFQTKTMLILTYFFSFLQKYLKWTHSFHPLTFIFVINQFWQFSVSSLNLSKIQMRGNLNREKFWTKNFHFGLQNLRWLKIDSLKILLSLSNFLNAIKSDTNSTAKIAEFVIFINNLSLIKFINYLRLF